MLYLCAFFFFFFTKEDKYDKNEHAEIYVSACALVVRVCSGIHGNN